MGRLEFVGSGYARKYGHWIAKPELNDGKWGVYGGDHPQDPDGTTTSMNFYKTKKRALSAAKKRYRKWLVRELRKIDKESGE